MLLDPARRRAHHLLPRVLTSQAHPHPGARETFASSPLHPDSLLVPAPQPLTYLPARAGGSRISMVNQKLESPPGLPFLRPPPAQRNSRASGIRRPLSLPFWRREEYSMVFSIVPAPAEEHHRELWSRVAGPSWWAWREVDRRLGGGAERRFPQTRRGETIEREGQRVMRVRRWSDRLPQTSQLEARAGEWRACGKGRPPRARGGKGFVCGFHA